MGDSRPLFRQAAKDAQRDASFGEIILVRPLSFTLMTSIAAVMAAALVLLFTIGGYTRRTTVEGVVAPDTGLVKIYAQQAGTVLRRQVTEGQHVAQGQALYTVSSDVRSEAQGQTQAVLIEQARQRRLSLEQEIDKTRMLQQDEHDTLQQRISSLESVLSRLNEQIAGQRARAALAADGAARYARLLTQDYVSRDQAQERQADLLDQQSRLQQFERDRQNTLQSLKEARNDLASLGLKQQNQLSQLQRGVIDVDQRVTEGEARRALVIATPEAGTVAAAIAEQGQVVDTARPVASIVPTGAQWQVHLFVPSTAIGFVKVGAPVLIRYQAFPYQKFGQYRAKVTSVARTALSPAELEISGMPAGASAAAGTFYRVIATLDAQQVMAYGKPQPLQAGMTLQADILQEHRRLYEWVLEPLFSLTGKL